MLLQALIGEIDESRLNRLVIEKRVGCDSGVRRLVLARRTGMVMTIISSSIEFLKVEVINVHVHAVHVEPCKDVFFLIAEIH